MYSIKALCSAPLFQKINHVMAGQVSGYLSSSKASEHTSDDQIYSIKALNRLGAFIK